MGNEESHGGSGTAAGIDPVALDKFIEDAGTAAEDIETFVTRYRSRFTTLNVSTANLTQLEQVAEWVHDQRPMLERRRDLAQLAADQSGTSFVTAGAGELVWDTADEAAAAGREDAERLLEDLGPGDEIPQEVYDLLMEHNQDPDYVEAFFNNAGDGFLAQFQYDVGRNYDGDKPYDPAKMVPLSYALATASHRIDFTDEQWLVDATLQPDPWNTMPYFMEYGQWSESFLHAAADQLTGYITSDQQVTVLNALARNPVAAATWYQGTPSEKRGWDTNAELVAAIMQGNMHMLDSDELHDAMLNVLDAATVRVGRFDQNLADQSILTLLESVHEMDGSPVLVQYQKWFGELAERHIDDIYDSVTSPSETYFSELREDRAGVEAPAALWASLPEHGHRGTEPAGDQGVGFGGK
jgi:hypothetical protein